MLPFFCGVGLVTDFKLIIKKRKTPELSLAHQRLFEHQVLITSYNILACR